MPTFTYKAINASGKAVTGTLDASDRKHAVKQLASKQLNPVTLQAGGKAKSAAAAKKASLASFKVNKARKAPRKKLINISSNSKIGLNFLRKMLELMSSGMPLGDAIKLLSVRLSDPVLKKLAQEIWKELSEGRTFATIAEDRKDYFGASTPPLIQAGEATGNLVPILQRIVTYKEESNEMRANVISGLIYPLVVTFLAFGLVVFFLFFLLPKIRGMMEKLGGDMHWSTSFLLWSADFLITFGPFILFGLIIIGLMWWQWRSTPQGREALDRMALKIPFTGRIIYYSEVFQSSTLLATLMESGINATEALRLVEQTINNSVLRAKFAVSRTQIQEGVAMATALQRTEFLEDTSVDILTVGENTGNVVHSLKEMSKIYARGLTARLSLMNNVITYGALGFAFALVFLIALGIVLSVVNVSTALQSAG